MLSFRQLLYNKASPVIVHLLMIFGVALYAIFGALIMQKLETKRVGEGDKSRSNRMIRMNEPFPEINQSDSNHEIRQRTQLGQDIIDTETRRKREMALVSRSRKCVERALQRLMEYQCNLLILDRMTVKMIDRCYHVTGQNAPGLESIAFKYTHDGLQLAEDQVEYVEPWSFSDSILFSFTIITTIGYGNLAPRTFQGRLFCILYALIGIPFTLLAIADLGKFFSELIETFDYYSRRFQRKLKKMYRRKRGFEFGSALSLTKSSFKNDDISSIENGEMIQSLDDMKDGIKSDVDHESNKKPLDDEDEEDQPISHGLPLLAIFVIYSFTGALLMSAYEPDMSFFKALYFNFITLTSIGLGDVVPKSESFMVVTLLYIAIGLALTTIAIDIAADYLKKLHYYGRKIENVGNVVIWFGGKTLTMKQLVKNLGDQFNLPVNTIDNLNLDKFVDDAIKVEDGEIETLRPPPFEPEDVFVESEVGYADEETEPWSPMKTPTPSPSPEPSPEPPMEPTPPPSPSPSPEPSPKETTPEPEPEPEPQRDLTPEPNPSPPREPTPEPEPESPSPPPSLTAEELAAQKRKAYSEEAWRRYQEYQKQWKKFRQTQFVNPATGRRRSSTRSQVKSEKSLENSGSATSPTSSKLLAPPNEMKTESSKKTVTEVKITTVRRADLNLFAFPLISFNLVSLTKSFGLMEYPGMFSYPHDISYLSLDSRTRQNGYNSIEFESRFRPTQRSHRYFDELFNRFQPQRRSILSRSPVATPKRVSFIDTIDNNRSSQRSYDYKYDHSFKSDDSLNVERRYSEDCKKTVVEEVVEPVGRPLGRLRDPLWRDYDPITPLPLRSNFCDYDRRGYSYDSNLRKAHSLSTFQYDDYEEKSYERRVEGADPWYDRRCYRLH
uniref:TWiK family of potassium channels protein 7 n=1 Tax=Bursaphelenchus xylophilus TaxID=6326 RepID=A0A1I7S3L0_BURXY